jgi:hypothetical protein
MIKPLKAIARGVLMSRKRPHAHRLSGISPNFDIRHSILDILRFSSPRIDGAMGIAILFVLLLLPSPTRAFTPVSIPLFAIDPSNSLWMNHLLLNGDYDQLPLWGQIQIDGASKRFMGDNSHGATNGFTQKSLSVNATQTIIVLADAVVRLTVTFTSPKLLDELDAIARPVNYVTFDAVSLNGAAHAVQINVNSSGGWHIGTSAGAQQTLDFGSVGATSVSRHVCVGHDEAVTVKWLGASLRPWWNRKGDKTFAQMFTDAEAEYARLCPKCQTFDAQVRAEAMVAGDTIYADLCGQGYRQCHYMLKLVAYNDSTPWLFSLEGSSGLLIQTVDVVFPQSPLFLAYNPAVLKMMLDPVFLLYESGHCSVTDPPPHDLGPWPTVNGCNIGYWVEEASNMMIMPAAICHLEKSGAYAQKHWQMLSRWADWLRRNGLDPVSQNSTDDFSGSYPHSCLLATKALLGIGSYVKMATMIGQADSARKYRAILDTATAGVIRRGYENGHFKKANDLPGTWSQKYNLVWDKPLGLNVFADSIAANEMKVYLANLHHCGVPLLSTETYNKSDWELWSAAITGKKSDFMALATAEWNYLNESGRVCCAIEDLHFTETCAPRPPGFPGRGVVGGYFIKIAIDKCTGTAADGNSRFHVPRATTPASVMGTRASAPGVDVYTVRGERVTRRCGAGSYLLRVKTDHGTELVRRIVVE